MSKQAAAKQPQPPPVRGDVVVFREGYETFEEAYGTVGIVTDFQWRKSKHYEGVHKLFLRVNITDPNELKRKHPRSQMLVPFARVSEWWTPAAGEQD